MIKIQRTLTGTRAPKTTDPEVIATSTVGNIRMNTIACEKMGISAGQYVSVAKAQVDGYDEDQFVVNFIDEDEGGRSKLGYANSSNKAGALQFSSASSWKSMGGDENQLNVFHVAGDGITDDEGNVWYVLEHVGSRAKRSDEELEAEEADSNEEE